MSMCTSEVVDSGLPWAGEESDSWVGTYRDLRHMWQEWHKLLLCDTEFVASMSRWPILCLPSVRGISTHLVCGRWTNISTSG